MRLAEQIFLVVAPTAYQRRTEALLRTGLPPDATITDVTSAFAGRWTGVFNIGTGVATSVNTLIAEMAKILGPAPGVRHAPARAGGVELDRSCLDCGKADRQGLWRPKTALAEGLALTAKVAK